MERDRTVQTMNRDNMVALLPIVRGLWHRHSTLLLRFLYLLLILWVLLSLSKVVWALWPQPAVVPSTLPTMNPPTATRAAAQGETIAVGELTGLNLFGQPDAAMSVDEAITNSQGVGEIPEQALSAPETRLALTLTGILATSDEGVGSAIIEARNSQGVYHIGDLLPVGNNVTLARVLPNKVVLDNNGRYESLTLFEATTSFTETTPARLSEEDRVEDPRQKPSTAGGVEDNPAPTVNVTDRQARVLAAQYRQQLYDNPQSLSQVVRVSAVMRDGRLAGYRVAPGSNPGAFKSLGFQSGDIVTAVNGLSLDDPSNTVRLYQTMRDATAASFDVERAGQSLSISVSLSDLE